MDLDYLGWADSTCDCLANRRGLYCAPEDRGPGMEHNASHSNVNNLLKYIKYLNW